ncbi:MAG: hypothetical protein ACN0LA_02960 [Candidatus Longimicrobiales bacterium M2_2A_002]
MIRRVHHRVLYTGGTIRALSVSLLAVVALVAGLVLNRSRQPDSQAHGIQADSPESDGVVRLDAIRQAGI